MDSPCSDLHADPGRFQRGVLWLTLVAMVAQPVGVSAQVIAAAAGPYRPQVDSAANGVPLIQIAAPSAASVSRNQYQQFDVAARGVVLNNSRTTVQTQLAGFIAGNPSLAAGAARVILNEVTSSLPSSLRGYTEVGGSKAEVVIANPNGITCGGCGFINASRGVLTTGTPVFGAGGSLDAFRVVGGQITVDGAGLNASNIDQIDLIARAVKVNAGIWGQALNVAGGAGQVAYADFSRQALAGDGAAPVVSIDVAQLGGMYAGRIRLVGGETGVGVANAGQIAASTGDIVISAAGKLTLAGSLNAGGQAVLSSTQDIDNSGTLYSAGKLTLQGDGRISNSGTLAAQGDVRLTAASVDSSGTLAAGLDAQGLVTRPGALNVSADGELRAVGLNLAGGAMTLSGSDLDLTGARTRTVGDMALRATQGDIVHSGGTLQSGGNLNLTAGGLIDNRNGGQIGATGAVTVNAGQLLNTQGRITAANTLSIAGVQAIDNRQGILGADGDVRVAAPTVDNTTGVITAIAGDVAIDHNGAASTLLDNTAGAITAGQDIALKASTLTNQGGTAAAGRDVRLATSNLGGSGTLLANRDLAITYNGSYTQSVGNLIQVNRDLSFMLTGDLINQGSLGAVGSLKLAAATIDNRSGASLEGAIAQLAATQSLTNAGTIAATTATLDADTLTNTGSVSGKDITVNARKLSNLGTGVFAAARSLDLHVTDTLSNLDGGLLYSADHLAIAGNDTRDANGWLSTATSHLINRSADIQASGDAEITATTVDNQRTSIVTATRTLSTRTELIQERDGGWSSGTAGMVFPNSHGSDYWHIDASAIPTFVILDLNAGGRRYARITEQKQDYVVSATPEARILAGGDLYLRAGTVNNIASRIEAAGALNADVTTLNNTGYTLYNSTRETLWKGGCSDIQGDVPGTLGSCHSGWIWSVRVSDTLAGLNASLDSVFHGGQSLTLITKTVDNSTVDAHGVSPGGINLTVNPQAQPANGTYTVTPFTFTLPTSALYTVHPSSTSHYLVETDPRFTQYSSFVSSDYMLQRLGLDPAVIQKRLGDGYYEQQLVRDQIITLRGQASLGNYASLDAEYLALLEAGAAYAREFSLVPGVSLTQQQIAGLAHDMVWLEERVVDGQRVLVPVVYLAQVSETGETRATGAIIGGGVSTRIDAVDINNSGRIVASGQTTLTASHDIVSDSGTIVGQNVVLAAGNDLHLGTATQSVTLAPGQTFTHEGLAGRIDGQNVSLSAGRDLTLAGGQIQAGDAALAAGRDLTIGTQTLATEQHLQNGDSRYDRSATTERASQIVTSGDLTLSANHDLAIVGSDLTSGEKLTGSAGNNLILQAAHDQESVTYNSQNEHVTDSYQSASSSARTGTLDAGQSLSLTAGNTLASEGTTLRAKEDIAIAAGTVVLDAAHDRQSSATRYSSTGTGGQQQAQSQVDSDSARGGIVDAGRNLSITSSGDTTVVGSALAAGQSATIKTGGDLVLLAAQSSHSADIQSSGSTHTSATSLTFSEREVRQLLTTITVGTAQQSSSEGGSLDLQVGGNFLAETGERRADGTLNADRMTTAGIVRGDSRQQVSVKRTGDGADANPADSQVLGNLAAQGIRNGSNESFAPTAANASQSGSAALQQYLASGLVQIKSNPQVAGELQAVLQNGNGSTLTYKDASGKVTLTVAGQAKVQAVYNTLKLSETFDEKHFADQGLAQIVTLVAAIALTVMTAGAGAESIGAVMASSAGMGATSATMIDAAVVAMTSTMTGQLAGGASFDEAFQAGLKAGVSSAMTAGILNAPVIDGGAQGMQSINQLANVQTTGANIVGKFSIDTLGQNLVGMTARGVVNAGVNSAIYGGSFGESFKSSLVSDTAAVGANAVGLSTKTQSPENVLGHAAVGAVAAQLKGQDAVSGAIGGAASALVNPLLDQAIGGSDGSGWGSDLQTAQQWQSGTLQLASMGVSAGIASAFGKDGLTAATAAQNETVNNFLTKENILQKQARLAQARDAEKRAAIIKEYIRTGTENTNAAFSGLKSSVMTETDLEQKRADLQKLLTGPIAPSVRAEIQQSISEINGILTGAHTAENMEPVWLAADALLTVVTAGDYAIGKFGLKSLGRLVEGVGAKGGAAAESEIGATFSTSQLDKKFKHAEDFGLSTTKKNPETLAQYQQAIESHLADPSTYQHGTYQYVSGSTVYYNPATNNVVVLGKDGAFVSGWKLDVGSPQFQNFIKNGVLR